MLTVFPLTRRLFRVRPFFAWRLFSSILPVKIMTRRVPPILLLSKFIIITLAFLLILRCRLLTRKLKNRLFVLKRQKFRLIMMTIRQRNRRRKPCCLKLKPRKIRRRNRALTRPRWRLLVRSLMITGRGFRRTFRRRKFLNWRLLVKTVVPRWGTCFRFRRQKFIIFFRVVSLFRRGRGAGNRVTVTARTVNVRVDLTNRRAFSKIVQLRLQWGKPR